MSDDQQPNDDNRVDREFRSLMEGLRTTLPGAQVLVAFLLILPVQASFDVLTTDERVAYYIAFATSVVASVLLIAPSVHQRMRSPLTGVTRNTSSHLRAAVRLTIVGTIALLVALISVSYLVTSLVFDAQTAAAASAVVLFIAGYTWIYQPLVAFRSEDH